MRDWKTVPIGNVVEFPRTWNPLRSASDEVFDYIDLSAVNQDSKSIIGAREISCKEAPSRARQLVAKGDILVSTVRPNLNGVAQVPENLDGATASTGFCILRPRSSLLDGRFLFQWVKSPVFIADMINKATGASYPAVSDRIILESILPLPSLQEQKRIADILDRAEALRSKRKVTLAQLDELVQSIFIEMFGDPIINPMGWNTKKLEKLCVKIFGGGTPSKSKPEYYEGGIPWVTPKDMKQDFIQDSIDHISEKAVEESSTKLIPPNCLLMVIRSGILKKKLPVAVNMCEVTVNQDMKSFLFDNRLTDSYFMLYFFKIYQRELLNRVRSVTADNLEFNQIKEINVIVPPIEKQQKFTKIVEHLERVRSSQKKSLFEINCLFDSLMHEAFTGKLFSHQSFERHMENGGDL